MSEDPCNKKGGMAVALNPTKTLYSIKKSKDEEMIKINNNNANANNSKTNNYNSDNNGNNFYADSPSRQLRRSARVASLSPSSFAPLISASSNSSGTNSAISSSSSYAPASPSRKYSLIKSGKLDSEIVLESDSNGSILGKDFIQLNLFFSF